MQHYALPSEGGSIFENVIAKLPKDKYYYGEGIEIPSDIFDEYAEYVDVLCPYHENWGRQKSVRFYEFSPIVPILFLYKLTILYIFSHNLQAKRLYKRSKRCYSIRDKK